MSKVIGIGSAVADTLLEVEKYPAEDTKLEAKKVRRQCGGPCATALVAVSKLGLDAEYLGTLGDDSNGQYIREQMERFGVRTDCVRMAEGTASFSSVVLLNEASASRTCIWNRGNAPEPELSDVPDGKFSEADILHLDGHHLGLAIEAAERMRSLGKKVSLDAGGLYPGIGKLLPLVQILIPSEEFALGFTGESDPVRAAQKLEEQFHPEILIVTQGVRGGFLLEGGKERRYPSFRVKPVDSNGAGDTFHGAFLAALLKGYKVPEAAEYASAASAIKCTKFGAQEGIPGDGEVTSFIQSRKDGQ